MVVAHGSGSSRFSPRNRAVAEELSRSGLGVLRVGLLIEPGALERVASLAVAWFRRYLTLSAR